MSMHQGTDVVIVGGGVIGCAIAYLLRADVASVLGEKRRQKNDRAKVSDGRSREHELSEFAFASASGGANATAATMTTLENEISVIRLLQSRCHQLHHSGSGLGSKPERQDDPPALRSAAASHRRRCTWAISIMDSAGLFELSVFHRHEDVGAFQVPPSVLDGTCEAKGRHSIAMTLGLVSA
jgi:hypothetical protein